MTSLHTPTEQLALQFPAAISRRVRFDGKTYDPDRDGDRLAKQMLAVFSAMSDHCWHTLPDLSAATAAPEASVSARLRDLRKERFGGHVIERRYVRRGLFEYRMNPHAQA